MGGAERHHSCLPVGGQFEKIGRQPVGVQDRGQHGCHARQNNPAQDGNGVGLDIEVPLIEVELNNGNNID